MGIPLWHRLRCVPPRNGMEPRRAVSIWPAKNRLCNLAVCRCAVSSSLDGGFTSNHLGMPPIRKEYYVPLLDCVESPCRDTAPPYASMMCEKFALLIRICSERPKRSC